MVSRADVHVCQLLESMCWSRKLASCAQHAHDQFAAYLATWPLSVSGQVVPQGGVRDGQRRGWQVVGLAR
jgi:hypothetical protein